jgi:hypothetical protein
MEVIYFTLVLISLLYVLYKFKNDLICSLIILTFFVALPEYLGKTFENPFKGLLLSLTILLLLKIRPFYRLDKKERNVILAFSLVTLSFVISVYINSTNIVLSLSQYAKLFTPFCMFFLLRHYVLKEKLKFDKIRLLFLYLITIQIVLSVLKFLILGIRESTVGSISFVGGGAATTLPILGFIYLWMIRKGSITSKDWIYIVFLLFIGFVSVKRAIWFIMPLTLILFMVYIPRKKLSKKYLIAIPLLPLVLYFGIRLNPTLNKEKAIWGTFDLDYALNYANEYSFGKEENLIGTELKSEGRGGATFLFFKKLLNIDEYKQQDFFGYGLDEFYTKDYTEFDKEKFGVNHRGSVTGIFGQYITLGYFGAVSFTLYLLSILTYIEEKRIRYSIIIFVLWDYLFYSGLMTQTQGLFVLLIFLIHYTNLQWKIGLYARYLIKVKQIKKSNLKKILATAN